MHEKLRSKHIRTLEALQAMVREHEAVKTQLLALQQQLDLANAARGGGAVSAESAESVELLTAQCERLACENNQLAGQLESAEAACEQNGEAHQRALQTMRADKARLKRERGAAVAEAAQATEENEQLREECVELREKSQRAWELEVQVRALTLEVEALEAEVARRKGE